MLYCTAEAIAAYCIAKANMCALQRSDEIGSVLQNKEGASSVIYKEG